MTDDRFADRESTGPARLEGRTDREYFQRLETLFIDLRGAPLLLSPSDWETARAWHSKSIPIDLVSRVLRDVFDRRSEHRGRSGIRGLRYFDSAVQKAWAEVRELGVGGADSPPEPLDIGARLSSLASALPSRPAGIEAIRRSLLEAQGSAEEIESELMRLDQELLKTAARAVGPDRRAEIAEAVEEALGRLRGRVSQDEREALGSRLEKRHLRRVFGLPVLSLFSP
ncbi:MAG: hypothetical protein OEM62_11595, partial [Acidobacteriota bacterium]|nr:hypothetical protein [Acidobacteriota bacterium]